MFILFGFLYPMIVQNSWCLIDNPMFSKEFPPYRGGKLDHLRLTSELDERVLLNSWGSSLSWSVKSCQKSVETKSWWLWNTERRQMEHRKLCSSNVYSTLSPYWGELQRHVEKVFFTKCEWKNYDHKVLSKVITNRLAEILEFQPPEQAGFRRGYGTIDHIYILTYYLSLKSKEYNQPLISHLRESWGRSVLEWKPRLG